jgi:hypothetical protein
MHSRNFSDDSTAVVALRGILARLPRRPDVWIRASENSNHIGAMLAESALQAGLDYEAVVVPRVKQFLLKYGAASTVSGLLQALRAARAETVLGIKNSRKCRTLVELADLLSAEGVETADDFRTWLQQPESRSKLLAVYGVGVKTAAYLRLLAGLPAIAIDIHLRRAAADVGVVRSDDELERLYTAAAQAEAIPLPEVDGSLWQDGAERSRRRRRRRAT